MIPRSKRVSPSSPYNCLLVNHLTRNDNKVIQKLSYVLNKTLDKRSGILLIGAESPALPPATLPPSTTYNHKNPNLLIIRAQSDS